MLYRMDIQSNFLKAYSLRFYLLVVHILFEIGFLEFLSLPKDHILKFLIFFVLLKECSVAIQNSIFQMRTLLFYKLEENYKDMGDRTNCMNLNN